MNIRPNTRASKTAAPAATTAAPNKGPSKVRPIATATIEPTGLRTMVPREHVITVVIQFDTADHRHCDQIFVTSAARRSLAGFPPPDGQLDQRRFADLSTTRRSNKAGGNISVAVGVEGSAVLSGRPENDAVDRLCAALIEDGYRVIVREKRECAEPGCNTSAMLDWNRPADVLPGWYSSLICGKHNYRTCSRCKSVYVLTSMNAAGQAPSVHCEVCEAVLIEWGSSKIWSATLVTRGLFPA